MNAPRPDHVLVVEDEPRLARLVSDYLVAAGYSTRIVDHGLDVLWPCDCCRPT